MGEQVVSSKRVIGKKVLSQLEKILAEDHSFQHKEDLVQLAREYGYPGPASMIVIEYWFYQKSSTEIAKLLGMTSFPIRNFLHKKAAQFNHTLLLRGKGGPNNISASFDSLQSDCNCS